MSFSLNPADFVHLAPVLFLTVWACLVLLASAIGGGHGRHYGLLAILGLILSGLGVALSWVQHVQPATDLFAGMMVVDRFALFLDMIFIIAGILTALVADAYLEEHRFTEGEFFALLLLSISGMMMMVHAGDLVMFVIGLETMSLAIYALVASWPGQRRSAEAGFKYFLMGAVASAFLLYGIALLYGVTGTTNLAKLAGVINGKAGEPLVLVGMFMILGAMGFKVALVPFHMWTPDAYEGAPTPVTGFMAAAVKAAGFGALLRLVAGLFSADAWTFGSTGWINIFWVLSVLTMTIGNISALRQNNVKRMLAYSSIAHAGYLLIGVVVVGLDPSQMGAVLFYVVAYAVTTLGAFAVVAWIGSRDVERTTLEDWYGVAKHHPAVALAMMLFLFSLGGLPPTAGFFAKFYLFKAALSFDSPQMLTLVLIAIANSVVSMYYYLRPIVAMYFREGASAPKPLTSFSVYWVLGITSALVLILGMAPDATLAWAAQALMGG
ncbi:MAG: NADH-quinone oxidoreductase subunit N [Deltaproteobacteria bacterium]|nr:NADH-quinone oxidoreductase subunit N [Deltaproteobacteria bacterium]